MIDKSPILLTGCARSGTSLVAGVIDICGAFGGQTFSGSKYNAKGFFENSKIITDIEKPFLISQGLDPKGQNPLADPDQISIPSNWKLLIETAMIQEGYSSGPWYFKSARLSHIWPVWNYAFPNAKYVIVRRRTADIAESCLNTGFMNAYSNYQGWVKWVNYHEDRFVEMIKAGLNVKQIWPERMIRGNYEQMFEVIEWLGLEWKPDQVMEFIEPKLWKARKNQGIIK